MSLNRTIDKLARALKREAARNPDFADKLDAIFAAHVSRRPAQPTSKPAATPVIEPDAVDAPAINPIAIVSASGADMLAAELASEIYTQDALRALAVEHNLDPAGELDDADKDSIIAHIVAQAARRVERDRRLFDY